MVISLKLSLLVFFAFVFVSSALAQNLPSCKITSAANSGFHCNEKGLQNQCTTFAVLRTNNVYSSVSNLSYFLGIKRLALAEANGFSADAEFLSYGQPILIPIDCRCNAGLFEAELNKITNKGESFNDIAVSLEGLTSCEAIRKRNPSVPPWGLVEKLSLMVPLKCACPGTEFSPQGKILLSYPVKEGDTLANLALKFNVTIGNIVSVNSRLGTGFKPESLLTFSTLLIPLDGRPNLEKLVKPQQPSLGYPLTNRNPHKRKLKMWKIGVYVAVSVAAIGASIGTAVAFLLVHWKKKKQDSVKYRDLENQQLNLSVRTTSDKKVSFEGSQNPLDEQIAPHKMLVETYTTEELQKATEDFNSSNLIEDSVFHGRLKGKDLAIKRVPGDVIAKIEFSLFYDAIHHHPNILRLLGTSVNVGSDSFVVFEYAKNGSLKDWLHGGLAMKSQFIASCYCFLTWNQRLRICLDVATALQYMHHIMNPSYVHRNIKSRNIFLDEEFNAKIGNFGMAKCVEDKTEDHESYTSQSSAWNKGYLAPEYLQNNIISPSIDIFAYGVVLLEVLSGQAPISSQSDDNEENSVKLCDKIKSILPSDDAEELREWIDSSLGENYSFGTAVTLANLARSCVEDDPSSRPNAGEIVEKLLKLVEELPEKDQFNNMSESSCKPLVKAAAASGK